VIKINNPAASYLAVLDFATRSGVLNPKKLKLSLLFILISIFLLGGVSERHALACEFIRYSSYSEIAPNIFSSSSFNRSQNEKLLSIIKAGKSRINNTFGSMLSSPKVVIAATEYEASEYGSNAYGNALLTPFSQCIIFGPKGQNIDVVAHEYTHAEVHFRVGWLNHYLKIPIWFNEGISLLVDFREPYLVHNIELTQEEINSVKEKTTDFFSGKNVKKNYQAARIAVDGVDKSRLYDNLEKIRKGQDIKSAFSL